MTADMIPALFRKRPRHPEAYGPFRGAGERIRRLRPDRAHGGPNVDRPAPKRAAAQDVFLAIGERDCGPVGWGVSVIWRIAIFDPLPDVSGHVVEFERVGIEAPDLGGFSVVPFAAAT